METTTNEAKNGAAPAASTRVDVTPLCEAIFGGGSARIERAFDLMSVAEEEIKEAMRKAPRKAKALRDSFRYLYSPELVLFADDLYRSHCREIFGRVKRGEDLSPGTDAECLVAFHEASLKAPPNADFARAMSEVFFRVFPDRPREVFDVGSESYPGRTGEIVAELRKKLARDRDTVRR